MPLADLTEEERNIVGACLQAVAYGPFFPDSEFEKLFHLTREEMRYVADRYPDVDEFDEGVGGCDDSGIAIHNAFACLLGYPNVIESDWNAWIHVSLEDVNRIWCKWRS